MVLKYDAIGCSRIPIHNVRLSANKSDSALGIFNGRFKFTFFLSTLVLKHLKGDPNKLYIKS
jgi:hypothetical protein